MEKRKPSSMLGGTVSWRSHCGKECRGSSENQKQNCHTIQQSHSWAKTQTKLSLKKVNVPSMFIAALFTTAKTWKQKCPSTDEWIKKMRCIIYNGILDRKRNEIGPFVVMWMDLESVIHNEVNQKNKYHVVTIYMESRKMVQGSTICGAVTEMQM